MKEFGVVLILIICNEVLLLHDYSYISAHLTRQFQSSYAFKLTLPKHYCHQLHNSHMKRKLHQSLSMQGQGETESRAVATVNSRFEFTFVVNESVTTLWPG